MPIRIVSEHENDNRKAIVFIDTKEEYYGVDFYENGSIIDTEMYPDKSYHWAEDCAENWVMNIKKVVNGD